MGFVFKILAGAAVGALAQRYAGVPASARPTSLAEVQAAAAALRGLQPPSAVTFLTDWLDAKRTETTDHAQ